METNLNKSYDDILKEMRSKNKVDNKTDNKRDVNLLKRDKDVELRRTKLDESVYYEFLPYMLKGFEHFYGKENIPFIKERINDAIFFPYFLKSPNLEEEVDIETQKLFAKLEGLDKEPLLEEDKKEFKENVCDLIKKQKLQSAMVSSTTSGNKLIPIVLLEMSAFQFYLRMIHEFIHAIDTNENEEKIFSGFDIDEHKQRLFNEYFTDKIALDIFNYIKQSGCPMLEEEAIEKNFMNSGAYWAPDYFMKDFYEKYKKEICLCKLNNSHQIFIDTLGQETTNKLFDCCEFMAKNIYLGASEDQIDRAIDYRDECELLVKAHLKKSENRQYTIEGSI